VKKTNLDRSAERVSNYAQLDTYRTLGVRLLPVEQNNNFVLFPSRTQHLTLSGTIHATAYGGTT